MKHVTLTLEQLNALFPEPKPAKPTAAREPKSQATLTKIGGNGNGHVKEYAISVSDDGKNWRDPILTGKLKTSASGKQNISFPAPSARPFIEFEVTAANSPKERFLAAIGELDVVVADKQ
jgi:hypothetical protein